MVKKASENGDRPPGGDKTFMSLADLTPDPANARGIYLIRNNASGCCYIGSTVVSFAKRWREHRSALRRGVHVNSHLQASWQKYEECVFSWAILEVIDSNAVGEREQFWLEHYRTLGRVYNVGECADNPMTGRKHTEETRQHLSRVKTGIKADPNHIRRLADIAARPFPSFYNRITSEIIPAGRNLSDLCRRRGWNQNTVWQVVKGHRQSYQNWLPVGRKKTTTHAKSFPSLVNRSTGETVLGGVNLSEFCRERGLLRENSRFVIEGKRKSHRGWALAA